MVHSLQNLHLFLLIEMRFTVNCQDGWTALMSAAQNGHKNVVDTLLHHGARVDMTTEVSAAEQLQTSSLTFLPSCFTLWPPLLCRGYISPRASALCT